MLFIRHTSYNNELHSDKCFHHLCLHHFLITERAHMEQEYGISADSTHHTDVACTPSIQTIVESNRKHFNNIMYNTIPIKNTHLSCNWSFYILFVALWTDTSFAIWQIQSPSARIWKVVLSICTFSLLQTYSFYKNKKERKTQFKNYPRERTTTL